MGNLYTYLAFLLILLLIFKYLFYNNHKLPPSPLALPVLGHLHLIKNSPQQALQTLSSKYGPILYLKFGHKPFVIISSPSLAEECFTKNDIIFANRPATISGDCLTYNYTAYIWAPYGDLWRILRRVTVIELFSSKSLQKYSSIREEEVRKLISHLKKISTSGNQKAELKYRFSLLTYSIIMRLVNGEECVRNEVAGTDEGKKLFEEIRAKFVSTSPLNMSDLFPVLRWIDYQGVEKRMKLLYKTRDKFLKGLIDKYKKKEADINGIREVKPCLVGTLLGLQQSDPDFFTEDVIKSLILVMFVGGTETSSATIDKAIELLVNHPHVLQKLRQEIDDQVGNHRFLEESDLAKLPYLHCAINETLRLYPPAPLLLPHYSSEHCTIGGYHIPQGSTLLINVYAIQRNPKVWEEPEGFKPERFDSIKEEGERFKFLTFGAGRRACPGSNMAMCVICLTIGTLIQCFDLAKDETSEPACSIRKNAVELLSQL